MMKRLVYSLIIFSILLFACTISTTATPQVATTAPAATLETPAVTATPTSTPETPTATGAPTATETPATPPAPQANVTCNELALFLDPALASGFSCQTVSESSDLNGPGFDLNPQYTELTFTGYVLADRFFTPHISIYPVQRFSEIAPDTIPQRVTELQALIGGGPVGDKGLPLLPIFNAAQEFYAQYNVIAFQSGSGIRFLTQYSQAADPINSHEMFYTFQGLTSDGKHWISAILPTSNPVLLADGSNPPNGLSWDDFSNNFVPYIADLTTQLNSQPPENYSPTIIMLDALIASIKIQP
jgi:hypothetical protein